MTRHEGKQPSRRAASASPDGEPSLVLLGLVSDACARRSGQMQYFSSLEPDLSAPPVKIGAAEIEGFTELDEHVERHQEAKDVFPSRVIDEILDHHERPPGGRAS